MSEQPDGGFGGDELARMLHAVQDWATRTFPPPVAGEHGPDCQWCPLCQFMAVVRGERPELTDRLVEAGTSLVTALRTLLDAAGAGGQASSSGSASASQEKPRVQRIDLGGGPAADVPAGDVPAGDAPAGNQD